MIFSLNLRIEQLDLYAEYDNFVLPYTLEIQGDVYICSQRLGIQHNCSFRCETRSNWYSNITGWNIDIPVYSLTYLIPFKIYYKFFSNSTWSCPWQWKIYVNLIWHHTVQIDTHMSYFKNMAPSIQSSHSSSSSSTSASSDSLSTRRIMKKWNVQSYSSSVFHLKTTTLRNLDIISNVVR